MTGIAVAPDPLEPLEGLRSHRRAARRSRRSGRPCLSSPRSISVLSAASAALRSLPICRASASAASRHAPDGSCCAAVSAACASPRRISMIRELRVIARGSGPDLDRLTDRLFGLIEAVEPRRDNSEPAVPIILATARDFSASRVRLTACFHLAESCELGSQIEFRLAVVRRQGYRHGETLPPHRASRSRRTEAQSPGKCARPQDWEQSKRAIRRLARFCICVLCRGAPEELRREPSPRSDSPAPGERIARIELRRLRVILDRLTIISFRVTSKIEPTLQQSVVGLKAPARWPIVCAAACAPGRSFVLSAPATACVISSWSAKKSLYGRS